MRIDLNGVDYSAGGNKVLEEITCTLTKGISYVIGKNGAGKSTLLKLLSTAVQPEVGEIKYTTLVCKPEIGIYRRKLNTEEIRKIIGFLPQHFTGHSEMTVEKYLTYIAFHKGIPRSLVKTTVQQWLEDCHLDQDKHKKLRDLSGGQLQKVGLIQALINFPRILILDEPFEGLDIEERLYFQRVIERLSFHSVVIISTHLLEEIQSPSEDKILYLNGGRIAYFGGTEELKSVAQYLEG